MTGLLIPPNHTYSIDLLESSEKVGRPWLLLVDGPNGVDAKRAAALKLSWEPTGARVKVRLLYSSVPSCMKSSVLN